MLQFWLSLSVLQGSSSLTYVAHVLQTAGPRDLSEVPTKQKKPSGKNKLDSPTVESLSSADLPVPSSDEFIPAPPKARGKKKPETSVPKPRYL